MSKKTGSDAGSFRAGEKGEAGINGDDRLKALETRLQAARKRGKQPEKAPSRGVALGKAFRLVTELVAGLVVGGFIGWYLDQWLGTTPIMLLIFFILGVAAGVLNVMRTARTMGAEASQDNSALLDHERGDGDRRER